jgi:hypothetical protein
MPEDAQQPTVPENAPTPPGGPGEGPPGVPLSKSGERNPWAAPTTSADTGQGPGYTVAGSGHAAPSAHDQRTVTSVPGVGGTPPGPQPWGAAPLHSPGAEASAGGSHNPFAPPGGGVPTDGAAGPFAPPGGAVSAGGSTNPFAAPAVAAPAGGSGNPFAPPGAAVPPGGSAAGPYAPPSINPFAAPGATAGPGPYVPPGPAAPMGSAAGPFAPPPAPVAPHAHGEPVPPPPIGPEGPGLVPYGYPGGYGYPGTGPQGAPGYYGWPGMAPMPSNGAGTTALVLGIIADVVFCLWPVAILLGVVALVLGSLGRGKAARGEATNPGQALAGIICGAVGIVLALTMIAFLVANP